MVRGEGSKKIIGFNCENVVSGGHKMVNNDQGEMTSEKVKVILGEGPISRRQECRVFYNKNCTLSDIESLLVRPLGHSISVCKARGRQGGADALAGEINENPICQQRLLFDIRNTESDKFMNSIIYNDQDKVSSPTECRAFDLWSAQSKVKFGFIPLTDPIMPSRADTSHIKCRDPIELHNEVKKYDLQNYLGARIPVESQLNIQAWESLLEGYWDK